MSTPGSPVAGHAAGVPFLAVPPGGRRRPNAPVVLGWHLQDPPRTETAFAAALPLDGLDAWRIYLGLPLSGSRLPAGGQDEVMRRGYDDAVLHLYGPVSAQAAAEAAPALGELRALLGLGDGPVGLLGGSMGAAVALQVLADGSLDAVAAVLVSPLVQLRPSVAVNGRRYGITYPWSAPSLEVAARLDFVARAEDIAAHGEPAVLVLAGAEDDREGVLDPAERLRDRLSGLYRTPARAQLELIEGMAHALAEAPGDEPAPQTPQATEVDRRAVGWLREHLME